MINSNLAMQARSSNMNLVHRMNTPLTTLDSVIQVLQNDMSSVDESLQKEINSYKNTINVLQGYQSIYDCETLRDISFRFDTLKYN